MIAAQTQFPFVWLMTPDSTGVGIRRGRALAIYKEIKKKRWNVKSYDRLHPQTMCSSTVNPLLFLSAGVLFPSITILLLKVMLLYHYSHVVLSVTHLSHVFEVWEEAEKLERCFLTPDLVPWRNKNLVSNHSFWLLTSGDITFTSNLSDHSPFSSLNGNV